MVIRNDRFRSKQSGAVLLIALVILVMMMLIAASVIRLSMRHTQVVNNEQVRTEAETAADYALDLVLNTPATKWDGYRNAGKTEYVNLGISNKTDTQANSVAVTVSNLTCKRTRVIKNAELIKKTGTLYYVAASDASCFGGGGSPLTIVDPTALGSPTDDSLCANVLYEMQAQVTDPKLLEAKVTVAQGVEVRSSVDNLAACN
jgi:flagellar basal body-associated protein FliL